MKVRVLLLILFATAALAGCQRPAGDSGPPPLTLPQWTALPADAKYTPDTLERVKQGDPKFQDEAAWDRFVKTVVTTARKKDFPGGLKMP